MKHAALPGFRDFYPEEMARRQQIFSAWREVARRYGFEEYDGPPLESLELYVEKSGPEIVKQLFNFVDKGGRDVALRPEMTPTIVRMLGARIKGMPRPIRWFSTPQLFRYEKQQRGRLREHFQLNMDIVGDDSELADADLVCAALDVLKLLGLGPEDVIARISDRRLLQEMLLQLGIGSDQLAAAYSIIDKVEREKRSVLLERLGELGVPPESAEAILGITTLTLDDIRERYGSNPAIAEALARLDRYFSAIRSLGFGDWVGFDMRIVRGLAYYTGIVFELFDRKGELRAICGGGRYDNLFASLTGIDIPALGFGFGDVVLGELLKERGLAANVDRKVDFVVIPVDDESRDYALSVVATLRGSGRAVMFPYRSQGVGKALKAAVAAGVRFALVIGADEIAKGTLVIKDLASGADRSISLGELLKEQS